MSYGRVSVVINWALDNWEDFDSWCCVKGIDPLELPAYRFYNLILFALKENLEGDQLHLLLSKLALADRNKHPFHTPLMMYKKLPTKSTSSKSRDAQPRQHIPSWWRGEDQAYQSAKIAMKGVQTLPKAAN